MKSAEASTKQPLLCSRAGSMVLLASLSFTVGCIISTWLEAPRRVTVPSPMDSGALGALPDAMPSATGARPTLASTPAQVARPNSAVPHGAPASNDSCFVLIDRHNHKTGGTTMREIFQTNEQYGDCVYWGYGQDEPHWSRFLRNATEVLRPGKRPPGRVHLCLEAHFPVFRFMSDRVPRIARLREAVKGPGGCKVVLTTRVREPLSFYLSYFKWDIAGRQQRGETAQYGKSFLEWSPPNLQTNALQNAFSTEFASRYYDNRFPKRWQGFLDVRNETFEALLRALDEFDLVGTVEDFDSSLLLTNDLIGGALPRLQYARTQPVHRHRSEKLPPLRSEEVCPDMAACRAHVRRIAPLDHHLYNV